MKIDIGEKDFGTLCICAIRYCQGRKTYMPSLVREIITPHIDKISDNDLNVMIHDCEFQKQCDMYGDEKIDKPGWLQWEEFLKAEKEKRNER